MIINENEVSSWDASYKLTFLNALAGYKSVHLLGSMSSKSRTSLKLIESLISFDDDPMQVAFVIGPSSRQRQAYENIIESEYFTINHIHKSFLKQAHYTAIQLENDMSEFEACNLKEEYIQGFRAPFVKESTIKFGLSLLEDVQVRSNNSHIILGKVQLIDVNTEYVGANGQIDLQMAHDVCVAGVNQYSSVTKFVQYPTARLDEIPNFYKKERADSVVFDKTTQTYNSSLLPYGTSIGAPSINASGVSTWKNSSINSFNHALNNKIENLKDDYQQLINEYKINELIYNSNMSFEPIIGKTYHLYEKDNVAEHFLSIIPPESWKKKCLGSFKLRADKIWEQIPSGSIEKE